MARCAGPRLGPGPVRLHAGGAGPVPKDSQVRLRVDADTDVAAVLAAVQDRADLVSFSYQPPTLLELFRQAVAA